MPRTIETEAKIKGGLPVIVEGIVWPAEAGWAPQAEVREIYWHSGHKLTRKAYDSLSNKDWETCADALIEESGL